MENKVETNGGAAPKVSVIVPVYKAEKYLRKCVDSILAQTFRDFEVLLVDDGSPDKSGEICEEYAKKDPRVRVFHKENGGVSSARNKGIDEARGEWITFVDADDWLSLETFECLSTYFKDYDVIRFSMVSVFPAYSKTKELNEGVTREEYIKLLVERRTILGVCGGLYRLDKIREAGLRFREDIINGEDWLFQFQAVCRCERLRVVNKGLYYYNLDSEYSCTANPNLRKSLSGIDAFHAIRSFVDSHGMRVSDRSLATGYVEIYFEALISLSVSVSKEIDFERKYFYLQRYACYPSFREIVMTKNSLSRKALLIFMRCLWGANLFRSLIKSMYRRRRRSRLQQTMAC